MRGVSLWLIHWPCWHACTTSPAFQAWALQKRRNETELAFVCSNLLATKETEESRKMIVGHNAVAFIHKHEHTHTYTNENKHTHTCIHTHSHNWVPWGQVSYAGLHYFSYGSMLPSIPAATFQQVLREVGTDHVTFSDIALKLCRRGVV